MEGGREGGREGESERARAREREREREFLALHIFLNSKKINRAV